MISSPNHSPRGPRPVQLVVIHTAEGARTTAELGAFFAQPASQVSSHVGIDAVGVEQYVSYDQEAWTLRNGNPISDNAELCAYAALTREQWLSDNTVSFQHPTLHRTVTVDHPHRILLNAATWAASRCQARGIPLVKLTPADVAAGHSGVIGHVDWTDGMRDGDHRDPGPGFPWDEFMAAVHAAHPSSESDIEEDDVGFQCIPYAWPAGSGAYKLVVPIGDASQLIGAGWFSLACDGPLDHFDVWFQADDGGIGEQHGALAKDQRGWWPLPNGTTQVVVHYQAGGPVGATIELRGK